MENISNNIMIDPSLIVARKTINNTFNRIRGFSNKGFKFYLPKSFQSILYKHGKYQEYPFPKFFLQNAYPSDFKELKYLIDEHRNIIKWFKAPLNYKEKYKWFYKSLSQQPHFESRYFDEHILMVLFEEWIFLQEYSWIVSRIKKTFNKFIDTGAVCLQFSKRTVKRIPRKTLNKNEGDTISKVDMLRVFGKWIARGGLSVLSYFYPVASAFHIPVEICFVLFDPMTTTDNIQFSSLTQMPSALCKQARR